MKTYTVYRTIYWSFKVEAADKDDALDHAMENIDSIEEAHSTDIWDEWEVEEYKGLDCGPDPYDIPMTEEEIERGCYEEMMMEQSKRDRRLWEESELGKQYALVRNQVIMENNCSELGFEETSRLISEKSKMFGLEFKCRKAKELCK